MTVEFECVTRVRMPRAQLFERSLSIDVHTESLANTRERAIAGVTSGVMSLGETVTWRAWHFGLPLRLTTRITELRAPDFFVDEQVRGPFARFRHEHRFTSEGDHTVMVDRVIFAAPLGVLGRIVERAILARYMKNLIETRNRHLAGLDLLSTDG
ncbi:cyclase [Mycetocola tolaasinivorans]|uniref:Cyclase n=1 Tax=Mycetocola tolaasinivorans TaxID=76635 RepID=A0A3L7A635_9MICO|nr:SRPBCC family protein [Mycetocola tolaasinivorans]RLP75759.1 cyclase [Mycetocola tolaasinivorans]